MMMRLPALTCFVLLGAGAQPMAPTPQFKVSMDLASALRARDLAKVMDLFTDDAVVMPPGQDLIAGRKPIEAAVKELMAKNAVQVAIVSIGSTGSETLGLDAGLYELTVKPSEGVAKKDRGKYLAVVRQDAEGRWRLTHLSWNSSEGPAPLK